MKVVEPSPENQHQDLPENYTTQLKSPARPRQSSYNIFSSAFASLRKPRPETSNAIPIQEAKVVVKQRTLSLSGAKLANNKKKISKGVCLLSILSVILFITVIILGVRLNQEKANVLELEQAAEDDVDDIDQADDVDDDVNDFFCGSEEEDQRLRELIADSVRINNGNELQMQDVFIPCFPDDITREFEDNELNFINSDSFTRITANRLGLQTISPNAFNFSTLLRLDLSQNSLNTLEDDVFVQLPNLDTLILDDNGFTSLENDVFSRNQELRGISIRKNNLFSLPVAPFLAPNVFALNFLDCFSLIDASNIDIAELNPTATLSFLNIGNSGLSNIINAAQLEELLNAQGRNINFDL